MNIDALITEIEEVVNEAPEGLITDRYQAWAWCQEAKEWAILGRTRPAVAALRAALDCIIE